MKPDFTGVVRQAMAPLADRYGLLETGVSEVPVLRRIVFSNDKRVIRFYLDVRDGYVDAQYAPHTVLNRDGSLVEPAIQSAAALGSVYALLKAEGIVIPDRYDGLYEPGRLEQAVGELVDGIVRHTREVLGLIE